MSLHSSLTYSLVQLEGFTSPDEYLTYVFSHAHNTSASKLMPWSEGIRDNPKLLIKKKGWVKFSTPLCEYSCKAKRRIKKPPFFHNFFKKYAYGNLASSHFNRPFPTYSLWPLQFELFFAESGPLVLLVTFPVCLLMRAGGVIVGPVFRTSGEMFGTLVADKVFAA